MQKAGYVALGSLAMHGREHATVLRSGQRGLILHTLYYAKEVRSEEEWSADIQVVAPKELELACLLVEAMESKFEPEKLKDAFQQRLRELINSRSAAALTPGISHAAHQEPVEDIMEALRRSLEAKRKPVEKEGGRGPKKTSVQKRRRA